MAETLKSEGTSTPSTPTPAPAPTSLKLADLVFADDWNREKVGDIRGLTQSIKTQGQQVPIIVRPHPTKKGKYIIKDGRRRYAALKDADIKEALVFVSESKDDDEAYLESLLINLQREDNTDYEKALVFGKLVEKGMKSKEIAQRMGVAEGYVSHRLAILKLPAKWQNEVKKGALGVTHARMFAPLFSSDTVSDTTKAEKLIERILEGKMDSTRAQEQIDKYLTKKVEKAKAKGEAPKGKVKQGAKKTSSKKKPNGDETPEEEMITTAYTPEVQAVMKMISLKDTVEWLQYYEERLSRTTSTTNKTRIKCVMEGLEIACGLRGEEE